MLLKILTLILSIGFCRSQIASHLLFPLENYLKSLPPFKIPQPTYAPVDVQAFTVRPSTIQEKSAFVTEGTTKLEKITKSTTITIPETTNSNDIQDIQQKANLKRLPIGAEEILPEFQPQVKINQKPKQKGDEEMFTESQSFVTFNQEKLDQKISPASPVISASTSTSATTIETATATTTGAAAATATVIATASTTSTATTTEGDAIGTTRDLLARFRPKVKPEGHPNLTEREFLKNIPRIKFSEVDRGEDNHLRPINSI